MQTIGTVKFVQIQREPLKLIHNPDAGYDDRIYRTSPIEKMTQLQLTGNGILGIDDAEQVITDVHNETHPQTRFRGDNKISFGFIQHYERMRGRFGEHIQDGYAGENIIIEANIDILTLDSNRRFFIKHEDTLIEMQNVIPAPPCRPFSIFCAEEDLRGRDLKEALQFLSNGTRGYYADVALADEPYLVQAGDSLLVV